MSTATAPAADSTIADLVASWPRLTERKRGQLARLLRDAPTDPRRRPSSPATGAFN